jgi:hypothetical protein
VRACLIQIMGEFIERRSELLCEAGQRAAVRGCQGVEPRRHPLRAQVILIECLASDELVVLRALPTDLEVHAVSPVFAARSRRRRQGRARFSQSSYELAWGNWGYPWGKTGLIRLLISATMGLANRGGRG